MPAPTSGTARRGGRRGISADVRAGAASMAPLVVGYVPCALVVGTVRAGLAAITALIAVSRQSAARGQATPAALGAVAVGTALAARQASMPGIVAAGGTMYAAVRLGSVLW